MKVAIVHDWLVNYGGAELFVEYLLKIYPDAEIFTLVYDKKRIGNHFLNNKIHTSKIQKLPMASRIYTKLLKFMPAAFESFDFTGFDLVISSSSCSAKGVRLSKKEKSMRRSCLLQRIRGSSRKIFWMR